MEKQDEVEQMEAMVDRMPFLNWLEFGAGSNLWRWRLTSSI